MPAPDDTLPIGPLTAPDGSVYVVNDSTKELGTVPAEEVGALGGAFRLASSQEVQRQSDLDNMGVGEKVLGGLEALGRGATFGLSDLASDVGAGLGSLAAGSDFERGFEQARQDRLLREEALGGVGTALELTGGIAPALLSGGTSLGAKALALAPSAVLERKGAQLAGKVIGDQAAAGIGRTAAGRALGGALEGGVGAAVQAGTEVAPAFVDDPMAAAEAIVTAGATGLAIGAGAGSVFGLAEGALNKGARSIASDEAARAAAMAAPPPPAATADDIVAMNAQRPAMSAQLPDPPRDKIQTMLDRSDAAFGGYAAKLDETSAALWDDLAAQKRTLDAFDYRMGVDAKRAANDISARELAEEATDVLDQPVYDGPTFYHASKNPITEWHGGAYDANFALSAEPRAATTYLNAGDRKMPGTGYVYEFQLPKGTKLANEEEVLQVLGEVDPTAQYSSAWDAVDNRPDLRAALTERGFDGAQLGGGPTATVSLFSPQKVAPKMTGARALKDVGNALDSSGKFRSTTTDAIAPYAIKGAKPALRTLTKRHVESKKLIKGIINEINGYRAGLPEGDVRGLARLVKELESDVSALDAAARQGDNGEMFAVLDQRVRRRLWDAADEADNNAIRQRAVGWAQQPQTFLEDTNTWSRLAERQRLANPTWSDRMTKSQEQNYRGLFRTSLEKRPDGLGNARTPDSAAVRSAVSSIGSQGSESLDMSLRANIRAEVADAVNRAKAWGGPEAQAMADAIARRGKAMEDRLDALALVRRDFDAANDPNAIGNQLLKGLASVPVVGGPGAIVTRVGVRAIAKKGDNLLKTISRAASTAVKTTAKGAGKVASVAPLATVALTAKKREELIDEAQQLQSLTSPRTRAMLQEAAALAKSDPQLAEALVTQKAQVAQYILSKLPVPVSQATFAPGAKLDPVSARKLDRTLAAIANPQAAVQRMGEGSSSPEDLDVVKTLFPTTYAQFTQAVAAEMAKMKVPPSLTQRVRIGRLTGLNVDAALERIADLQKQAQATTPGGDGAQVPQSGNAKVTMNPDRFTSRADQILTGK